jgi:hypothetical protein
MDLEDTGCRARFLIRDRDGKFPHLFNAILANAGIQVVLSGIQMPKMNSIVERRIQTCRPLGCAHSPHHNAHWLTSSASTTTCSPSRPRRAHRSAKPPPIRNASPPG